MCDGQEWVEGEWNCVFAPEFENPNGSIFSEARGVIYQDAHAPMGIPWNEEGHAPKEHTGYPDAPHALGGKAGRPDLVQLLDTALDYKDVAPEGARPRRTFKVWNARLLQDEHIAKGGTLESFFEIHGYALVHAPTAVTDFTDAQQTLPGGAYPAEVEELAMGMAVGIDAGIF